MRKVVDARQVCHLWANKSQDQARTSSGNIYFDGPTLYSYGAHFVIAHHLEGGGILWNDASYSNTTSKQQGFARQSLASWQREKVISVPSLKADDVRELERVKRDGEGRTLPEMVRAIAGGIVSIVEDMAGMREGKGPEQSAFYKIKSREAAGLALCAYVAKGKRAPKWPLAPLPDTMPTGDARKAWIQSVAKGKLLSTYESTLAITLQSADQALRRSPAFYAVHKEEIDSILTQGEVMCSELKAKIAAKVEAWKAGEGTYLPEGAGTYARIKGNVVHTSLGAHVPLTHACRLARIARRVIGHGGKVWEHGAGPRVGGFMVRSIGADGSAVIGCHEFDGAEGLRMLALLDACPECANFTDEVTE